MVTTAKTLLSLGLLLTLAQVSAAPPTAPAVPGPPGVVPTPLPTAPLASPPPVAPGPPAAAPSAPAAPAPAPSAETAPTSGKAIFGNHMLRHSRLDADSAAAHFTPPLPYDGPMVAGAMRAVARLAFGQHQIAIADPDALKLDLGRSIDLKDLEYDYRFMLDGSPKGITTILVTRKALPPPAEDQELLELLRQLETM